MAIPGEPFSYHKQLNTTNTQSNSSWGGGVQITSTPFLWEGWVQLLPFGDVDQPIYCSRCRELLQRATEIMGRAFYSPRTGDSTALLVCPWFSDQNPHDAWILP